LGTRTRSAFSARRALSLIYTTRELEVTGDTGAAVQEEYQTSDPGDDRGHGQVAGSACCPALTAPVNSQKDLEMFSSRVAAAAVAPQIVYFSALKASNKQP
jgi:hypothetical protein